MKRQGQKRNGILFAVAAGAVFAAFGAFGAAAGGGARDNDSLAWRPKERWRGFNLLTMFIKDKKPDPAPGAIPPGFGYANAQDFREDDFQIIHDWGFNFVRIPLDYRYWVRGFEPLNVDEAVLAKLDRAIELGGRYGIHVQIAMHRVPGYRTGLSSAQAGGDILKDAKMQDRTCAIWADLARRYRDVPNERVSFNLLNEPPDESPDGLLYAAVAKKMIEAIRREDPKRLIFSDGLRGGKFPCKALFGIPGVGQAGRGYVPRGFITGGKGWPITLDSPQGVFANVGKPAWHAPFSVTGLPACAVELTFGSVSGPVTLVAKADGAVVGRISLDPTKKTGDRQWRKAFYVPRWKTWQGDYRGVERLELPRGAKRLTIQVESGDWLAVSSLTVVSPDGQRRAQLVFDNTFGKPSGFEQKFLGWDGVNFAAAGASARDRRYPDSPGKEFLYRKFFQPWEEAEKAGVFVMIGEFGAAHANLPHAIAKPWLEDMMGIWKDFGWGWAVWGLYRDKFGVLDNARTDVSLEDFRGHKLDRPSLEILLRN